MSKQLGYILTFKGEDRAKASIDAAYRQAGVPIFKTKDEAIAYGERLIKSLESLSLLFEIKPPTGVEIVTMKAFEADESVK